MRFELHIDEGLEVWSAISGEETKGYFYRYGGKGSWLYHSYSNSYTDYELDQILDAWPRLNSAQT